MPRAFRRHGPIVDAGITKQSGDVHAGCCRLEIQQPIENMRLFEKSEPALIVCRSRRSQVLREVAFGDERSQYTLREQCRVAVRGMLRVHEGAHEGLRHQRVRDSKAGE